MIKKYGKRVSMVVFVPVIERDRDERSSVRGRRDQLRDRAIGDDLAMLLEPLDLLYQDGGVAELIALEG
jgi:hypothetical protein